METLLNALAGRLFRLPSSTSRRTHPNSNLHAKSRMTMDSLIAVAASVPLAVAAPLSAHAQVVVEIEDRVACSACAIETGPSVTLAPPPDRAWFASMPGINVARDGAGNYIVGQVEGDGVLAVFGSDGEYVSSYGRIGGGPGEFAARFPLLVEVGAGDVPYVIGPLRLHTLSPRAEAGLNQVRLPVQPTDAVVLADGIAVSAVVRTGTGHATIQILRPDGTIDASIGVLGTGATPSELESRRVLGRSNDHLDVWSAPVNRYRLIRYGRDGEEKTRIERDAGWFRPYSDVNPAAPFHAPAKPSVSGVHQDANGLLWVAILRAPPSSSFSPLAGVGGARGEMPVSPGMNLSRFLHTTVEVLDPVAGELIARREFDEYITFVSTPGDDLFAYALRPDYDLGIRSCVITPLTLRRR